MPKKQTITKLETATQAAESIEFGTIFGSNVKPKWFDFLMLHSGTYLFSFALFLSVLKLGYSIYRFVTSQNRNINQSSSFVWDILQTIAIGIAIVGTLTAASIFAIATPALFVASMAADTLRNLSLLIWNAIKLASLFFQVRNKLNDPFTYMKYTALKQQYLDNIKAHALGVFVGSVLTAAATVIFLFPHIGLPAIGTTVVTIGVIKTTVAGMLGAAAAVGLAIPFIPLISKGVKKLITKVASSFKNTWTYFNTERPMPDEQKEQSNINEKLSETHTKNNVTSKKSSGPFKIRNDIELQEAMHHDLGFSAFSLSKRFRETIIDHIENKPLATKALKEMVEEKIISLKADITNGKLGGYRYFSEKQRPKREQKLHAMLLINNFLHGNHKSNIFENHEEYFKNSNQFQKQPLYETPIDLIRYIESSMSRVKESFFLEESDTQNILNAFKAYLMKFYVEEPSMQLAKLN